MPAHLRHSPPSKALCLPHRHPLGAGFLYRHHLGARPRIGTTTRPPIKLAPPFATTMQPTLPSPPRSRAFVAERCFSCWPVRKPILLASRFPIRRPARCPVFHRSPSTALSVRVPFSPFWGKLRHRVARQHSRRNVCPAPHGAADFPPPRFASADFPPLLVHLLPKPAFGAAP